MLWLFPMAKDMVLSARITQHRYLTEEEDKEKIIIIKNMVSSIKIFL